jgi:transglutaminase-like putative cysteine protease
MRRDVTSWLKLDASGEARLFLAIGVADGYDAHEQLEVTQSGRQLQSTLIQDLYGTRLHRVEVQQGTVEIAYSASVDGLADEPGPVDPADEIRFLRPSRYCESDELTPIAIAEFGGLSGSELLAAVSSWVGVHLAYIPGSSLPTDGAVRTLLSRRGVCRDYAHLVVAFLRALDVPARVASVYAPGLWPMDFHAVAEALVDGRWRAVDATTLAPRDSLVRIATGRDAADTAFLTVRGAAVSLLGVEVSAVVDVLPNDDLGRLVSLS